MQINLQPTYDKQSWFFKLRSLLENGVFEKRHYNFNYTSQFTSTEHMKSNFTVQLYFSKENVVTTQLNSPSDTPKCVDHDHCEGFWAFLTARTFVLDDKFCFEWAHTGIYYLHSCRPTSTKQRGFSTQLEATMLVISHGMLP